MERTARTRAGNLPSCDKTRSVTCKRKARPCDGPSSLGRLFYGNREKDCPERNRRQQSRLDVRQNNTHWGYRRRCTEARRRFAGFAVLERLLERVSSDTLTEDASSGSEARRKQEVHPSWSTQEDGSHRRFGVRCGKRNSHLQLSISQSSRVRREAGNGKAWEVSTSAKYVSC